MPGLPGAVVPMWAAWCPVAESSARMCAVSDGSTPNTSPPEVSAFGEQELVDLVVVADVDELECPRQVPLAAAGHHTAGGQFYGARQERHRGELDGDGDSGLEGHAAEVAEQPEAGHVGAAGGSGGQRQAGGNVVETNHRGNRCVGLGRRGPAVLDRSGQHADAERLGEHDVLPGAQPGVGEEAVGVRLVTAMPYLGSGSSMVWPPAITNPASSAMS